MNINRVLTLALMLTATTRTRAGDFEFYHENVMGTSLELRVETADPSSARLAEKRALEEIDRLSAIFSGYSPASELSRFMNAKAGTSVSTSRELYELFEQSDLWTRRSGGAFDPRIEAISRVWRDCERSGAVPGDRELAAAMTLFRDPAWQLDPQHRRVTRTSACPITLNAIAKGFIVEKACALAMSGDKRIKSLLLNVGGDLRACGPSDRAIAIVQPWDDSETSAPYTSIKVRDRAVATSGSSQRGFRIEGKWYSHIIDPRTGMPAEGVAGATVVAQRSADADALATILNVVPPPEGLRIVSGVKGAECLILDRDRRAWRSPGFAALETPRSRVRLASLDEPKREPEKKPEGRAWSDDNELVVSFELNNPQADRGRYRRPYVAVWIVDENGLSVRTLALWVSFGGAGFEQWIHELKRWHRDDQARQKTDDYDVAHAKNAVTRPTRPPGKYKVTWDGKDDRGKPLPAGEYTVCIDAAREHGTYQNIVAKVNVPDKPFKRDLKGGVEIKSASIEYRPKAPKKKGAKDENADE